MSERSKKVEQGDATREALLRAARDLFGERGYVGTSLEEIVQAAGVTKGALYHHFPGKEALFRTVFESVKKELSRETYVFEDLKKDLSRETSPFGTLEDDGEVWRDLVRRCRAFIERHTDPRVQRIVLLDARSVLRWDDWHRVESEYGIVMLRGTLRRALHRGLIAPLPLHSLAMILTGALTQACMLVANSEDQASAIEEAVAVIERFLEGLRPGTSRAGGPAQGHS